MYSYEYYDKLIISKEDFDKFNLDEIKQYMLEYANKNDWLDKRVNNTFKMKPWLKDYQITREDLKQDMYVRLYTLSTMKGFMSKDTIGRIKYANSIFSNMLIDVMRKNCKQVFIPLTEDMEIPDNYISNETIWVRELFIENSLESKILKQIEKGLTREEILKTLEISGRKFDAIKQNIKDIIKENE